MVALQSEVVYGLAMNSFQAMLKVFIVCFVGFLAAKYPRGSPLLTKPALQVVSKLSTYIFIPCLTMSSLGSSLSFPMLQKIGFIVLCSPFVTVVSQLMMRLCSGMMDASTNDALLKVIYVAVGFPNTISLPIMILQTLCEQAKVIIISINDLSSTQVVECD